MITSPQTMSAGEAGKYYYETAEHNTTWGGELSEKLGIKGSCTQEQFQKMLLGFHPTTGKQLVEKTGEERRAGADYTFTMSKNASILSFFDPRIEKSFEDSVNETLKIMEERYAATRIRTQENGENTRITVHTGNLAWTIFPHYASRNGDPQQHRHVFIHNLTMDPRGNLQSVEFRELFANKTYMGAIQESILAQKLAALGYEIDVDRTKGIADIKLDKEITKTFSSRTQEINIKESELRGKYPNMSRKAIRQLAEKETRPLKEHNPTQAETKEFIEKKATPEQQETIKDTVAKTMTVSAEQNLTESPEKRTDIGEGPKKKEISEYEAVKIGAKDIAETARYFRYERLENITLRHTFLKSDTNSIAGAISGREHRGDILKIKEIVEKEVNGEIKQIVKDTKYLTTPEILLDVRDNYMAIKRNAPSNAIAGSNIIKEHIEKYQTEHNRVITSGQAAFVKTVLEGNQKYFVVQGDAGVGKTTAMKIITQVAEAGGYKTIGVAHTGKAKERMQDAGVHELYTITKLQGLVSDGKITVDKNTVLIVDEASMVSDTQARFLNNLDTAKTIYAGDVKQFPSIDRGEFFKEAQTAAIESDLGTFVNMNQAIRFKGIQKEVAAALSSKKYKEAYEIIEGAGNVKTFFTPEMKISGLVNDYVAGIKEGKNIIIIVDTNNERNAINKGVRESLMREKILNPENEKQFTARETLNIRPENRLFVESYLTERVNENGDIVKNNTVLVGDRGKEYKLLDVNKEKNTLIVEDKNGNVKDIEITKLNKDDYLVYLEKEIKLTEGDKIVFLRNDKGSHVQNGEMVTATKVEGWVIEAVKPTGESVSIDIAKYNNIDYAYAVTGHKFQGEDINEVKYSADRQISGNFENNFYTMGTRAIEKVEIYGTKQEIEAFEEAVKNTAEASKTHAYISDQVFKEAMSIQETTTYESVHEQKENKKEEEFIEKEVQMEQQVQQEQQQAQQV